MVNVDEFVDNCGIGAVFGDRVYRRCGFVVWMLVR